MSKVMFSIALTTLFLLAVTIGVGTALQKIEEVGVPYTVYDNLTNCVFVTGGSGQPVAIAAYRKEYRKEHCD